MSARSVRIGDSDASGFEAWLSLPERGRGPGLVVLAEIYNANPWVRSMVERYAAEGYVVLAPDLYWRQVPGEYLPYTPEGQQRGRALAAEMDLAAFTEDLRACVTWLKQRPECNGRVGAVGFCLGGKLVWIGMAAGALDAGVAYYAVQLEQHLDAAKTIHAPLMMHFGSLDHRVPPELYERIEAALAGKPDAHTYWYEGADHGFSRDGYPPYHPEAAALARERSLRFLAQHLGGSTT
jgi:carboxymethylenebutenolidase